MPSVHSIWGSGVLIYEILYATMTKVNIKITIWLLK